MWLKDVCCVDFQKAKPLETDSMKNVTGALSSSSTRGRSVSATWESLLSSLGPSPRQVTDSLDIWQLVLLLADASGTLDSDEALPLPLVLDYCKGGTCMNSLPNVRHGLESFAQY